MDTNIYVNNVNIMFISSLVKCKMFHLFFNDNDNANETM